MMVTNSIHRSRLGVICPGQAKYTITMETKHSGGPGRLGSTVPAIPNNATKMAMIIRMMVNIDMALLLFLIAWLYYFVLNGNELSRQTVMHFFTSSLMMVSFPALIGCISLLSEDTAKLEQFGHIPPLISFFVLTETIISPYCNRKSFPLG